MNSHDFVWYLFWENRVVSGVNPDRPLRLVLFTSLLCLLARQTFVYFLWRGPVSSPDYQSKMCRIAPITEKPWIMSWLWDGPPSQCHNSKKASVATVSILNIPYFIGLVTYGACSEKSNVSTPGYSWVFLNGWNGVFFSVCHQTNTRWSGGILSRK